MGEEQAATGANRKIIEDNHMMIELSRMLQSRDEVLLSKLAPVVSESVRDGLSKLLKDKEVVESFFNVGVEVFKAKRNSKLGEWMVGVIASKWSWTLAFVGSIYLTSAEKAIKTLSEAYTWWKAQ